MKWIKSPASGIGVNESAETETYSKCAALWSLRGSKAPRSCRVGDYSRRLSDFFIITAGGGVWVTGAKEQMSNEAGGAEKKNIKPPCWRVWQARKKLRKSKLQTQAAKTGDWNNWREADWGAQGLILPPRGIGIMVNTICRLGNCTWTPPWVVIMR